jgi:hypothetical protein
MKPQCRILRSKTVWRNRRIEPLLRQHVLCYVAAYIGNRTPTSALKESKTPFEVWYGRKPNLAHLKVFGCMAYAHIIGENRKKLDKKAEKFRFIGYAGHSKGYRLFDEQSKKVVIRRDVIFNERDFDLTHSEQLKEEVEVELSPENESNLESGQNTRKKQQASARTCKIWI